MKPSIKKAMMLAPLAGPIVYVLFMVLFVPDTSPKQERTWQVVLMLLVMVFIPLSYFASLLFGGPLLYLLQRMNRLRFWWVVGLAAPLGAVASGCVVALLVIFSNLRGSGPHPWLFVAIVMLGGAAVGMVNAAVFGWLAGLLQPEKRADQAPDD